MTAPGESLAVTTLAFDRLAADYDTLTGGEIFRLMRARTHRAFMRHLTRHSRVLEIGCGTGADTALLAAHCAEVVACDPSEEMVTRTMRRLAHERLDARVTVMPCGLHDVQAYLDALTPCVPFDAVVSNFGALNCVCYLAPLAALMRRHLRPGGVVFLGVMTRWCALEAVYFALTGRAHLAGRRMGGGAVPVTVAGLEVPTYYHRIRELHEALGAGVRLLAVEGIGVAIPPPYLEARWRSLPPAARRAVTRLDAILAPWPPFNRCGDHVLLRFVKEPLDG